MPSSREPLARQEAVVQAEMARLARLLAVPEKEISFLQRLGPAELRQLRDQVTDALFDGDHEVLERLAAASRLVPVAVSAAIAQNVFGPLLAARLTALIEPQRAAEIARRQTVPYLAEVCALLDPRRVRALIANMPVELTIAVARELEKRRDYFTMGQMVGLVSQEALEAIVPGVGDEALVQILALSDAPERIHTARGLEAAR